MHMLQEPSPPSNRLAIFRLNIHINFDVPSVDVTMTPDNTTTLCAPIIARRSPRPLCTMPVRLIDVEVDDTPLQHGLHARNAWPASHPHIRQVDECIHRWHTHEGDDIDIAIIRSMSVEGFGIRRDMGTSSRPLRLSDHRGLEATLQAQRRHKEAGAARKRHDRKRHGLYPGSGPLWWGQTPKSCFRVVLILLREEYGVQGGGASLLKI
jgi:hypothetical protein